MAKYGAEKTPYLDIFQAVDLFRSIKMKIHRNFQSLFTSMFDVFPNCSDVQSAMRQR